MASVTLRIVVDAATRKRTIVVKYESDADALPMEHEDEHRAIVDKLFEGGIAKAGDTIVVEREGEGTLAAAPEPASEEEAREGSKEGA
ncbi:MAG: hypothetical protein KC657_21560 [Myxococcales bacterium]|nr:hypothetical protein [Myxococcales bacterium]